MDTNKLMKIQEILTRKQSERDKLLGKKESLLELLKEQGFNSLDDAEKELKILDEKIEKEEEILQENTILWEKKYGELL